MQGFSEIPHMQFLQHSFFFRFRSCSSYDSIDESNSNILKGSFLSFRMIIKLEKRDFSIFDFGPMYLVPANKTRDGKKYLCCSGYYNFH